MMATGSMTEHHVSGLYVTMLLENLAAELPPEAIGGVLARSGVNRSLEDLSDPSSWCSYDEFKALLQEAKRTLDSRSEVDTGWPTPRVNLESELAGTIQAFGSPSSVLGANTGTNPLVPIRRYETTEVAPNEWTIREWFVEGFEPFPEFCQFVAQQYAMVPRFFGLPEGEVIEEECQCRGDRACLFRMRWAEIDEVLARAEYFEARSQQLESPPRKAAGHDHRPGVERALRGRPPGHRRFDHGHGRGQWGHSCPRTPSRPSPKDLFHRHLRQ